MNNTQNRMSILPNRIIICVTNLFQANINEPVWRGGQYFMLAIFFLQLSSWEELRGQFQRLFNTFMTLIWFRKVRFQVFWPKNNLGINFLHILLLLFFAKMYLRRKETNIKRGENTILYNALKRRQARSKKRPYAALLLCCYLLQFGIGKPREKTPHGDGTAFKKFLLH